MVTLFAFVAGRNPFDCLSQRNPKLAVPSDLSLVGITFYALVLHLISVGFLRDNQANLKIVPHDSFTVIAVSDLASLAINIWVASGRLVSLHVSRDPSCDPGSRVHRAEELVRTTGPSRSAVARREIMAEECSCAESDVPGATSGSTLRKRRPAAQRAHRFRCRRVRCRWIQCWRPYNDSRNQRH